VGDKYLCVDVLGFSVLRVSALKKKPLDMVL